jgi:DNA-binding NarL/FixJ family response regulator
VFEQALCVPGRKTVLERETMYQQPGAPREEAQVTRREQEVIGLIAQGLSNQEIGRRLQIASREVSSCVHRISEKLGIRTRLEIAAYARRNGKHD